MIYTNSVHNMPMKTTHTPTAQPTAETGLLPYGWSESWREKFDASRQPGEVPARIIADHGHNLRAVCIAELNDTAGSSKHADTARQADSACEPTKVAWTAEPLVRWIGGEPRPTVGDWVAIRPDKPDAAGHSEGWYAVRMLPRVTALNRRSTDAVLHEQTIAANIDIVFVFASLQTPWRARKAERFLVAAWSSGATPIMLLSKCDLHPDVPAITAQVSNELFGVDVLAFSALTGEGMDAIRQRVHGKTCVMLGASGAGKSTLINALYGQEHFRTNAVREEDARGRHTTTHRGLLLLAENTVLIDTPGIRELGLWDEGDGISQTFSDIEELTKHCRFADCQHSREPGCAIRNAIRLGRLAPERLESYRRLAREATFLQQKANKQARVRASRRTDYSEDRTALRRALDDL